MRAFFCIPVPGPVKASIHETSEALRARTRMRASWVERANLHVTLRFLGDIDPEMTVELDELCRGITCRHGPFDCSLDRIGAFPDVRRARVIWVGGDAPKPFRSLTRALNSGLSELGFPPAKDESVLHVTVARIKDQPDPGLPELVTVLAPPAPWVMAADRVQLMESTLRPQGAEYRPLFTARLAGPRA